MCSLASGPLSCSYVGDTSCLFVTHQPRHQGYRYIIPIDEFKVDGTAPSSDHRETESYPERLVPMAVVSYVNILGWIGSAAVISAYALISLNKLNSRSGVYQVLNLAGSLCLVVNTAYYRAYPSTLVNIVWLVIAGLALIRIVRALDREATTT